VISCPSITPWVTLDRFPPTHQVPHLPTILHLPQPSLQQRRRKEKVEKKVDFVIVIDNVPVDYVKRKNVDFLVKGTGFLENVHNRT
jgi:hypothetical protein